jgi:hypothetical protein
MIVLQTVPPTPATPPFDPNLIFMNDGGLPGSVLLIIIAALTATVIILWPLMRAFGRRLEGRPTDAVLRAEVDQLHARVGDVDALQARILELEERVDFAERLLAQTPAQKGTLRGEGG